VFSGLLYDTQGVSLDFPSRPLRRLARGGCAKVDGLRWRRDHLAAGGASIGPKGSAATSSNGPATRRVVVHFAVAAVYDRRNQLNQKTAVIDRRYSKAKLNHYHAPATPHHFPNC